MKRERLRISYRLSGDVRPVDETEKAWESEY